MKSKAIFTKVLMILLTLTFTLGLSVSAYADTSTDEANKKLSAYIYNNGSSSAYTNTKSYDLSGGGTIDYQKVVTKDGLVNSNFELLTSSAKQDILSDMSKAADKAVKNNNLVSSQTKTTWLNQLQQCDGVGSQLMATLLQNTKPDYVTANRIYEPFSGIVGTCLALGAILIMAFLGLTMVADISYIGIPAFRLICDGESNNSNGGSNGDKPKFISYEAVSSIRMAEGGEGRDGQSGGTNKLAIGIYFKKRVIMLIVLGVCLLYLVQGQIFTLVSWILDLVHGFLGF